MDCIEILGGHSLSGELKVQGSKNLALPVMAACILHKGVTVLHNCPHITDVHLMIEILEELGAKCHWDGNTLTIDTKGVNRFDIPEKYGKTMRSSITLAGSLLGRFGKFTIPYPGGCVIGSRPIDFHLKGFCSMGTSIEEEDTWICGEAACLHGAHVRLPFPSVGATENIILAAVLAKGVTVIEGAAREPEIEGLCMFLNSLGAKIYGFGSHRIRIDGVECLHDTEFELWGDRIVAGTYLLGTVGTRGSLLLEDIPACQLRNLRYLLMRTGAHWREEQDKIFLCGKHAKGPVPYVRTSPYPGFSTDLQSQLLAVLAVAKGRSVVEETIFEARFKIVEALRFMGADLEVQGRRVFVQGVKQLQGAVLEAEELRGGAALVVAGLMAEGNTRINNPYYIDRGYENICLDLEKVGAKIRRKQDVHT